MDNVIPFPAKPVIETRLDLQGTLVKVGEVLKENGIEGQVMEVTVFDKNGTKVATVKATLP